MDSFWKGYVEEFVNDPFYWYQPKGYAIKRDNLPAIQRKLRILARFAGQPWRTAQAKCARAWREAGLYAPRSRRPRDLGAIVRMNKVVFDSLGLAWLTKGSIVEITDAGKEYLRTPDERSLRDLVARQAARYMYPNPCIGRSCEGAGLFPYIAMLEVLLHFRDGVPEECYELFIARMRSDADVQSTVVKVQRYLRLDDPERRALINRLDGLPILRNGKMTVSWRRKSRLHTVKLDSSYMKNLCKTPGLIQEEGSALRLDPARHAEAQGLVHQHLREGCFVGFASPEDWVAFYGQPERRPSYEEALLYYRSRGDIERSLEVFRVGKAKRRLPSSLMSYQESRFREMNLREKTLEDLLAGNLYLIEDGLVLEARQYRTPRGRLDILAKDTSGRWVVIELKRDRPGDKVVGQILRYRDFILAEKARNRSRRVRTIVVANKADAKLLAAARGARPVLIEVHELNLKISSERAYPRRAANGGA